MTRVGAIDCGTNSIRLLVADLEQGSDVAEGARGTDGANRADGADGTLTDVLRRMEIVRLGYGVDRTGSIDPEAMRRTLAMARQYASQCEELGVSAVRFVATSASRDASNAAEFIEGVRLAFASFGIAPEVISGHEEASLSFRGATGGVGGRGIPGPYLVVDIGGGSTEFVRGTAQVERSLSVDVGCVRMTERHLVSDPPTAAQVAAATADVDAAIGRAAEAVGFHGVSALVGLAGSVTTITAHALRLPRYDPSLIHLSRLPADQVIRACSELLAMPRAERAALPYLHPGRVDVIGAGALVWRCVVQRLAREARIGEVVTSEHDSLDGIALSVARPCAVPAGGEGTAMTSRATTMTGRARPATATTMVPRWPATDGG